jgi:hypothetical protein
MISKNCKILWENNLYFVVVILELSGGLYTSICTQIGYSVVFDICVGSQFFETLSPCFHMALFIRLEELRKCLLGVVCQAAQKLSTGSDEREREREKQAIAFPEIVVNKSLFILQLLLLLPLLGTKWLRLRSSYLM